jgi:hypothetical protein
MQPPDNILDELKSCALVCEEDFNWEIKREWTNGAHGPSATTALVCTHYDSGEQVKITFERIRPASTTQG